METIVNEEQIEQEVQQNEFAIEIDDLYKSYGPKEVLKGISLQVKYGELFGFVGKNGVGKSTTIDSMVGVKSFNKGKILIDGYDITKSPIEAKSSFGYVPSEPTCYEVMTGNEYLEFVASIYGLDERELRSNRAYLAGRLELSEEDLNKQISDYSHGMKQKICLIASLIHNPPVWILDEPTVGLDVMAIAELEKMMRGYADHGKCVFITSHNIEMVSRLCDRVAIVNNGKIVGLYDLKENPNRRLQLARIFINTYKEEI